MAGLADIVAYLDDKGVRLSLENGELMCRASRAAATEEIRNMIAILKPGLSRHLAGPHEPADDAVDFEIGPNVVGTYTPPQGCIAPRFACPVLGACDRHRAGRPCLIAESQEVAA